VLGTVLVVSGVVLFAYMVVLWLLSLPLRDVSIVDLGWGVGFVIVGWIAFALGDGADGRRLLLAVLVSAWGLRLAGYLLIRKRSTPGEDPRYTAIRQRRGSSFPLTSVGVVFLFQGALIWVVSLPVQAAAPQPTQLGPLDGIGAALWAIGLFFEVVGDVQLWQFKRDPANRGRVLDQGLWHWTRHPNYFGDMLVWWGIFLVGLAAGHTWWTVVSPLVMSTLLVRVSGKRLLEAHLGGRPGYADYMSRTSGLVPLPPRPARRSSR
jgi:steroid 5-alpha reductase family enzyme